MNLTRTALLTLLLAAPLGASAQTAAELVAVTAIQSTLAGVPAVRVPAGTSFVSNPRLAGSLAPALLGPDAARFEAPRLFTARGLATKLADAYVVQLTSNYAAAGFLQSGTRAVKTPTETWTRTDFTNDEGRAMVLFVSKRTDGVYFLTAAGK